MSDSPVEVTTRYATSVSDLTAAWAFVMAAIDRPGIGASPAVRITPVWTFREDGEEPRTFEVVVSGMVERTGSPMTDPRPDDGPRIILDDADHPAVEGGVYQISYTELVDGYRHAWHDGKRVRYGRKFGHPADARCPECKART